MKCGNVKLYIKSDKTIYIMILHGYVKKKFKCDFYLRRGDFIMFFYDKPAKWPIAKTNIKIYTHN